MEPELVTDTHVFFWGSVFSQWFSVPFVEDGITYAQAEQYMMAKKALLFDDKVAFDAIMSTSNPKTQKEIGRTIKNFDEDTWVEHRESIVTRGNYLKFSQHSHIREILMKYKDKILVEASPYDKIWGIGLGPSDPKVKDESNWNGLNLLGKCIMTARDILLEEETERLRKIEEQKEQK